MTAGAPALSAVLETSPPACRRPTALVVASVVVVAMLVGVPRVADRRAGAQLALRMAQGEIEAALDAYRQQHGVLPGRRVDAPLGTPRRARVVARQLSPWLAHGVPPNPRTGSARIRIVRPSEDARAVRAPGWILDPRTGELRAGHLESADAGFDD